MRINCWITPENRQALSHLITAVNIERAHSGLDEVSQAHVLNDIIARVAEMRTVNLCGVFLLNRRETFPATTDKNQGAA